MRKSPWDKGEIANLQGISGYPSDESTPTLHKIKMREGEVRVSSPGISRKRKRKRERRHRHLLAPGVEAESREDESTGQSGGRRWRQ
jgi:hypothetical protein